MKAKDYYKVYGDALIEEHSHISGYAVLPQDSPAHRLMKSFYDEASALVKLRHCQSNEAGISIIKELNQKWNALCDLFEKDGTRCPLKRDGFLNHFRAVMAEKQTRKEEACEQT
jgi:hypothetical protein